jgi:hypothetical protein
MKSMLILIGLLSLSACKTVGSDAPQPVPVEAPRILLKVYPRAVQAAVGTELKALPPGSASAGFIVDYGQLRRGVCAAEGWKQEACRMMRAGTGAQ